MALTDTEAVVLRSYNLAEADRIVVFFSRRLGLVRGVAHGARKTKSRFGAALEPCTIVRLVYFEKEGSDLGTVRSVEIERSLFGVSANPDVLTMIARIVDLTMTFMPPHEPSDDSFRLIKSVLDALGDSPGDARALGKYFEFWLLKLSGFLPSFRHCSKCHREICSVGHCGYLSPDLAMRCAECSDEMGMRTSDSVIQAMTAMAAIPPAEFSESVRAISRETERDLGDLLDRLIARSLEKVH